MKMSKHARHLIRKYRNALKQFEVLGVDALENEFLIKELNSSERELDDYIAQIEALLKMDHILNEADLA